MSENAKENALPRRRRPPDRRERILAEAEELARRGGYHGFSFRDIAARVGVKSASIHHHFPTKPDLVAALAERYTGAFLERLGPAEAPDALERLVAGFRASLVERNAMCLCGLLGAQADTLPEEVRKSVRRFFFRLRTWTETAIGGPGGRSRRSRAEALIAALEGALMLARIIGNPDVFERVAEQSVVATPRAVANWVPKA